MFTVEINDLEFSRAKATMIIRMLADLSVNVKLLNRLFGLFGGEL